MPGYLLTTVFASLLGISMTAHADWSGKGEAGLASSTSNAGAKTNTVAIKLDLANEIEQWKHAFGLSGVYTSSKAEATTDAPSPENLTTANRWEGHEQSNYNFSQRSFWFENVRYENDEIGSFENQAAVSTGFGHKIFDSENTQLSAQLGVGYKRFKKRDLGTDGDTIATGLLDLRQVLTTNTVLLNKLGVESGSDNTVIQNDLSLQVKMTDVLALALGYQLRYNTEPGSRVIGTTEYEFAHSDRLLTASLVYEFK